MLNFWSRNECCIISQTISCIVALFCSRWIMWSQMKACIQWGKGRHWASHHQNGRCVTSSDSPHLHPTPDAAVIGLVSVLMLVDEPSAGGWGLRLGSIKYSTREIISVWLFVSSQQLLCFGHYWGFLDKGNPVLPQRGSSCWLNLIAVWTDWQCLMSNQSQKDPWPLFLSLPPRVKRV